MSIEQNEQMHETNLLQDAREKLANAGILWDNQSDEGGVYSAMLFEESSSAVVSDSTGREYVFAVVVRQQTGNYDWERFRYLVDLKDNKYMDLGGVDTLNNVYGYSFDKISGKFYLNKPYSESDPQGTVYAEEISIDTIVNKGDWISLKQ